MTGMKRLSALAPFAATPAFAAEALQTIQKRSEGLLHFVDAYRNLTRIPKPNFQIFPVKTLFQQVRQLMRAQVNAKARKHATTA